MRSRSGLLSTVAAVAWIGVGGPANAQVCGGGSTLASIVYRQLFDCYYLPVNTSIFGIAPACGAAGFPSGDLSGVMAQVLYAPVGFGVRAFLNHDGSSSSLTGLGWFPQLTLYRTRPSFFRVMAIPTCTSLPVTQC